MKSDTGKFVLHHTRQTKSKNVYIYYSLAWYYRKNKKPYRIVLRNLGSLSKEEVDHYKKSIDCLNLVPNMQPCDISSVVVQQSKAYLSCAVGLFFWDYWGLSSVFDSAVHRGGVSVGDIAKVLTVIRFEACSSKSHTSQLFSETTLPLLTGIPPERYNTSRIFKELSRIEAHREALGKHIFNYAKHIGRTKGKLLFYDLSSGNLTGLRCVLAKWGHSKDGYCTHVVLMLVITPEGYPVYWDVLEGNTVDVSTIEALIRKLEGVYGKFESVICFDRGMVSDNNLKLLQDKGIEFITALDGNQIQYFDEFICFQSINEVKMLDYKKDMATIRATFISEGFKIEDDNLYFKELDIGQEKRLEIEGQTGKLDVGNRRYFLAFNPELAYLNDKHRKERVAEFVEWTGEQNDRLSQALADRKTATIHKAIKEEKRKRRIADVEIGYELEQYQVENMNKNGKLKKSKTFRINLSPINEDAYIKARRYDGLWVLVTNISKNRDAKFFIKTKFKTYFEIYRLKNNIEEAFRILSDFNEIEPFYVYKTEHIKAHFTLCVLSYLLSITILRKIRQSNKIENMGLHNIFSELRKCKQDAIELSKDKIIYKITKVTEKQKRILGALGCSHLVDKKYLYKNKIIHV